MRESICSQRKEGHSRLILRCLFLLVMTSTPGLLGWAQAAPRTATVSKIQERCLRAPAGSIVEEPRDRRSENGSLRVSLTIRSSTDPAWRWSDSSWSASNWSGPGSYDSILGHVRYCYLDEQGNQAPTLRLQPGDTLVVNLKNEISLPSTRLFLGFAFHRSQERSCGE